MLVAVALTLLVQVPPNAAQTVAEVCSHQYLPNVKANEEILEGKTEQREIRANQTHRWSYFNMNVSMMNVRDEYRKLIINLEPCRGIVYLFVRKTRLCYPNPYSCGLGGGEPRAANCEWTHFMSEIDGSRDGTPTFFELPLSSTRYYISVYAKVNSEYTLTVLADVGAFPRPGGNGRIYARQLRELQVQLSWDIAGYVPTGISETKQYWVYASMLLDNDNRTNMAVFMRPDKIMNTVCGLNETNTDREYSRIPAISCADGKCNATIDGVITDKRYVFNIIVESHRGFHMAYSGLIMRTDWQVIRQAASDKTLKVVGAVSGSVLGMVIIIYFLLLKLYG